MHAGRVRLDVRIQDGRRDLVDVDALGGLRKWEDGMIVEVQRLPVVGDIEVQQDAVRSTLDPVELAIVLICGVVPFPVRAERAFGALQLHRPTRRVGRCQSQGGGGIVGTRRDQTRWDENCLRAQRGRDGEAADDTAQHDER